MFMPMGLELGSKEVLPTELGEKTAPLYGNFLNK